MARQDLKLALKESDLMARAYVDHGEQHRERILECYSKVKRKAEAGNPGAKVRLAEYDAILAQYGVDIEMWRAGG
jgi:hypothetical protein